MTSDPGSGRPLKVLVYPHTLEIGGSQMNAVEIGAAVRDRGHEVAVYGQEGPLLEHIEQLGLPFIPAGDSGRRPSLTVARALRSCARTKGFDVIHGYEWPPILEAYAAGLRGGPVPVGTVMSMSVAGFIPRDLTLVVGTEEIRRYAAQSRGDHVSLIEPPVDVESNRPGAGDLGRFPRRDGSFTIVVVSRLADQLKLEGLLTTIRATAELARHCDAHLWMVGDGPARAAVETEVQHANARAGRQVVTMTGSLSDPRGCVRCRGRLHRHGRICASGPPRLPSRSWFRARAASSRCSHPRLCRSSSRRAGMALTTWAPRRPWRASWRSSGSLRTMPRREQHWASSDAM